MDKKRMRAKWLIALLLAVMLAPSVQGIEPPGPEERVVFGIPPLGLQNRVVVLDDEVGVMVSPVENNGDFFNEVWLVYDLEAAQFEGCWVAGCQFLFGCAETGNLVDIGAFPDGSELVFAITNIDGTFFTGPRDRNWDEFPHAGVFGAGAVTIDWEDQWGGGDFSWHNCIVEVAGAVIARE